MNPSNMINPIGAGNSYYPQMMPMMPVAPVSIKIDINPMPMPYQQDYQNNSVIYNVPQMSVFAPKEDEKNTANKKSEEKQVENKKVEDKIVETKNHEKTVDSTMAQILAAQAGVQMPAPTTQMKAAEVASKENKSEGKKEVKQNKPQIVAPEKMKTGIDLNGLISILTSPDYEEQADAMEAVSEVAMYAPERAGELLDTKVVDTLLNIMSKDTSSISGKEKALAERNKEYAMFTTAALQKLYSDEIKQVGNVDVPAQDLVGMAGIVNNLKSNPNPGVREAAVASLGYVSNPSNKKDIGKLIYEASNDQNASVRAQAEKQLGKIMSFSA